MELKHLPRLDEEGVRQYMRGEAVPVEIGWVVTEDPEDGERLIYAGLVIGIANEPGFGEDLVFARAGGEKEGRIYVDALSDDARVPVDQIIEYRSMGIEEFLKLTKKENY